ncbi:serine hydrolase [Pelagibius sp. Alg239-R121]|uniref:serine hydrolase domain-containing protein n=1 Tax=Pelagibius sp. Alg239-R121 TaxID=2993448 RepID=UPI0024A716C2|nr:serine hydrolase [Pelagibius sp. Alg239-R121]
MISHSFIGLFRRLLVLLLIIGLSACSRHQGTTQLCEPPGSNAEEPSDGPALYHPMAKPPDAEDDGWPVSNLEAEGVNPQLVGQMLGDIKAGEFTKIDSVLIARNGKLIFEAYFNGFGRDSTHDTQSVSKSLGSALAGIAVDRGLITDVDQPVSQFFPDHWPHIQTDREKKDRITLRHLLTMTPGFEAEENWGIGPRRTDEMRRTSDWYRYALDMPAAWEPGTRFSYNSPTAVLVGGVVAQAAGEPLPSFAKKHLFAPLGVTDYCWSITQSGQVATNSGIFLRPRDMLKFGQLYLNHGTWLGQRIISEHWVRESTRKHVASTRPDKPRVKSSRRGYGYQWWTRRTLPGEDAKLDLYLASGNGGQKIFVYPNLQLVVVFTGSHYGKPAGHAQPWKILDRYILPAVLL